MKKLQKIFTAVIVLLIVVYIVIVQTKEHSSAYSNNIYIFVAVVNAVIITAIHIAWLFVRVMVSSFGDALHNNHLAFRIMSLSKWFAKPGSLLLASMGGVIVSMMLLILYVTVGRSGQIIEDSYLSCFINMEGTACKACQAPLSEVAIGSQTNNDVCMLCEDAFNSVDFDPNASKEYYAQMPEFQKTQPIDYAKICL